MLPSWLQMDPALLAWLLSDCLAEQQQFWLQTLLALNPERQA